jgi:AcrR family transcriptional regulator
VTSTRDRGIVGDVARAGRHEWRHDDVVGRRRELYVRAAPVFQRFGYREATLKALADACGLSIPALYRYFPSKRAFALFPLVALYPELNDPGPDVAIGDPRMHLSGWIDAAVAEMPNYTLALQLSREVGLDRMEQRRVEENLAAHIAIVATLAQSAAPHLDDAAAREVASAMISIATGAVLTGIDIEPASLRRRLRALLRGYGILLPTTTSPAA